MKRPHAQKSRLALLGACVLAAVAAIVLAWSARPASAAVPAQQQPPAPSALPSSPPAPTVPQGPAPAPTLTALPTVAPPSTPAPPGELPGAPGGTTTPDTLTPAPERKGRPALISVVALPDSGVVGAGGTLGLTVVITNRGRGGAESVRLRLPLDAGRAAVLSFAADDEDTWVSRLAPDELEIRSGPLAGQGATVTATLRLALLADVPAGEPALAAFEVSWQDGAGGGVGRGNAPTMSAVAGRYALGLSPQTGPAGTTMAAASDLFAGDEPVTIWHTGADGQSTRVRSLRASGLGSLQLDFDSGGLAPGPYSLVFYGEWTGFTVDSGFLITQ